MQYSPMTYSISTSKINKSHLSRKQCVYALLHHIYHYGFPIDFWQEDSFLSNIY